MKARSSKHSKKHSREADEAKKEIEALKKFSSIIFFKVVGGFWLANIKRISDNRISLIFVHYNRCLQSLEAHPIESHFHRNFSSGVGRGEEGKIASSHTKNLAIKRINNHFSIMSLTASLVSAVVIEHSKLSEEKIANFNFKANPKDHFSASNES